jgi:hypothetical protein
MVENVNHIGGRGSVFLRQPQHDSHAAFDLDCHGCVRVGGEQCGCRK